jgi:hypothetical protein
MRRVELQTFMPGHHYGNIRQRDGGFEDFQPERPRFPARQSLGDNAEKV